MLRVAFFGGSGEGTMVPLRAVTAQHRVVALVRPGKASLVKSAVRSLLTCAALRRDPMTEYAEQHDVPIVNAVSGRDPQVGRRLGALNVDVICVAAFPWIIDSALLATARFGGVNVHPSLLPRHRGPVPLFWTYYHDDRTTGVTVHRMNEHADAGEILAQDAVPLARGYSARRLHADNAKRAACLLLKVLQQVEEHALEPKVQNPELATYAPHISQGRPMVNFNEWDTERIWHFLAGLCGQYQEPLRDARGRSAAYRSVLGYEAGGVSGSPGTIERASEGWRLYCRDGIVLLGEAEAGQ